MVMVASLIGSQAVYAQPAAFHVPVHAIFAKSKMVSFTLSNQTKETVQVTVSGNTMSIEPGKSTNVKAAEGEKVLAANTTAHYAEGSVIVVASSAISQANIVLR
jgi:hypothetical protein